MTQQDNQDHNDQILNTLRAILTLISWLGVPTLGLLSLLIGAMVADHFDQVELRRDDNYMKPKVSRLWMEKHPDLPNELP